MGADVGSVVDVTVGAATAVDVGAEVAVALGAGVDDGVAKDIKVATGVEGGDGRPNWGVGDGTVGPTQDTERISRPIITERAGQISLMLMAPIISR